jgi:hypothetical protein
VAERRRRLRGRRYARCYAAHRLDPGRLQRLAAHMRLLLEAGAGGPPEALAALLGGALAALPGAKCALRHSYVLAYYLDDLPGRRYLEALQVGRAWCWARRVCWEKRGSGAEHGVASLAGRGICLVAQAAARSARVPTRRADLLLSPPPLGPPPPRVQAQLADSSERLLSVFESLPAAEQVLQGAGQQQGPAGAGFAAAAVSSVYARVQSWCSLLFRGASSAGGDGAAAGAEQGAGGGGAAQRQRAAQTERLEALLAGLGPQQAEQQLVYLALLAQQLPALELLAGEVAKAQHCLLSAARRGLLTRGTAAGSSDKFNWLDVVDLAAASGRHIAQQLVAGATGRLLSWASR